MKRILAFILFVIMCASLCACGTSTPAGTPEPASEHNKNEVNEAKPSLSTKSTNLEDYKLLNNGILEYWFIDYTMFPNYWTKGIYRAGTDFEPGDYYAIGIVSPIPEYSSADSPDDFHWSYYRTFYRVSINEKQFIQVGYGGILIPSEDFDESNMWQYGIFEVGKDIPAGLYKMETITDKYSSALTSVSGINGGYQITSTNPCNTESILVKGNILFDEQGYLTLEDGEYLSIVNLRLTYQD